MSQPINHEIMSPSSKFDVYVEGITLQDEPATLQIDLRIAGQPFFSRVTYHSIPSWTALWSRCDDSTLRPRLLGALVAWECMCFMALGGERLILCPGLACTEQVRALWTDCFRKQLGEWRYLNHLTYSSIDYPQLIVQNESLVAMEQSSAPSRKTAPPPRHLLTNGGGKDTLAGMLLLGETEVPYDLYEGFLPIGNSSIALQKQLLQRLKDAAARHDSQSIGVSVEDNYFSCPMTIFEEMGVQTTHIKTDFAVGHTANYVGYFPLILYHGYTHVWFNIERSADHANLFWHDEPINHQWCKSVEYQAKSTALFRAITGADWFAGFSSTLRGMYDTTIYQLVTRHPALLSATHSCNYGKPWCNRCPKCCFCYLMMTAYLGEEYARSVVGTKDSLFTMPENQTHWADLFDPTKVAWECVPAHEECQLAAFFCYQQGLTYPILTQYGNLDMEKAGALWQHYSTVDWPLIPAELRSALANQLAAAEDPLFTVLKTERTLVAA